MSTNLNHKVGLLLFNLMISQLVFADVGVVDVQDKSGNHTYFAMEDTPVMKCAEGILSVVSNNSNYSINLSDLQDFKFIKTIPTSISNVLQDNNIKYNGDRIYVTCNQNGEKCYIYAASGLLVKTLTGMPGIIDIDISDLSQGQYILKTSSLTFKFIKK